MRAAAALCRRACRVHSSALCGAEAASPCGTACATPAACAPQESRLHSSDIAFKPASSGWGYTKAYGVCRQPLLSAPVSAPKRLEEASDASAANNYDRIFGNKDKSDGAKEGAAAEAEGDSPKTAGATTRA